MPQVGKIGLEDIQRHDPADGSTIAQFNRTSRLDDQNTVSMTPLSAAGVPVLDAPIVSGGQSPFARISSTLAAKHVEACLADLASNLPEACNIERRGAISGDGVAEAVAVKNTEVFLDAAADCASLGLPLYMPGKIFRFGTVSGAILPLSGVSYLEVFSTGFGGIIKPHSASSNALPVMPMTNCSGVTLRNIAIDADTKAGAVRFYTTGTGYGGLRIMNVKLTATASGAYGVQVQASAAANFINGVRISECDIEADSAVEGSNVLTVEVAKNRFLGAKGFMALSCSGGTEYLSNVNVNDNFFLATANELSLLRTGTPDGSRHKGATIANNKISVGTVIVSGMNEIEVASNFLFNGGIKAVFTHTSAYNSRLLNNQIQGGISETDFPGESCGILVSGAGATLDGLEIAGGRIRGANMHGILVNLGTGGCRAGSIHDVLIVDCNAGDNGYNGISLVGSGTHTCSFMNVHHNQIVSTSGAAALHDNGISESALGCDYNVFSKNIVAGYTNAAINMVGANSVDDSTDTDFGGTAPW